LTQGLSTSHLVHEKRLLLLDISREALLLGLLDSLLEAMSLCLIVGVGLLLLLLYEPLLVTLQSLSELGIVVTFVVEVDGICRFAWLVIAEASMEMAAVVRAEHTCCGIVSSENAGRAQGWWKQANGRTYRFQRLRQWQLRRLTLCLYSSCRGSDGRIGEPMERTWETLSSEASIVHSVDGNRNLGVNRRSLAFPVLSQKALTSFGLRAILGVDGPMNQ
jgi:hypothetical protein